MRREKGFAHGLVIGVSVLIFMAGALGTPSASQAAFLPLHDFSTSGTDGTFPHGSLTLSGSTLYGMTSEGGGGVPSSGGTIFKINTGGGGYQILYPFTNESDGGGPYGNLTLSGSTLYGMTSGYGQYGDGTIFRTTTNAGAPVTMHSFSDSEGGDPRGSLTLSGSTLYGMTTSKGALDGSLGSIFSINTNGSGFDVLHYFITVSDGGGPTGSLAVAGPTLYGMTPVGGPNQGGTIFRINTDKTGWQVLHSFGSIANDGTNPYGDLTLSGSTLYGMTSLGGTHHHGAVFRIDTDGGNYQILYNFTGPSNNDGETPTGGLTLSGSTLYGMTSQGGSSLSYGAIFQINTDGSGYQQLYAFTGQTDGGAPQGSLTLSGSTLYGMTMQNGGVPDPAGSVFSLGVTPGPGAGLAVDFGSSGLWCYRNGAWSKLTPLAPVKMAAYGSYMVALFQGAGLYRYNGAAWTQLTPITNINLIVGMTDRVYVDFPGAGLWQYNGVWTRITALNANQMIAFGDSLVANFPGYGLYQYNGASWTQLTPLSSADSIVAAASTVYVHFPSAGLYAYSGGAWTGLTSLSPTMMQAYGNSLVANFAGLGLYCCNGSTFTWTQLTPLAAQSMLGTSTDLYVNFAAYGLYRYNDGWTRITPLSPTLMGSMCPWFVANFSGSGLYAYDGTGWGQFTAVSGATSTVQVHWP